MAFEMWDLWDIIINNEKLETITESEINDSLNLVEWTTEDYVASAKLAKFEAELWEEFDFSLSRNPDSNKYYIVDKVSLDNIDIGYSLDWLTEIFDTLKLILAEEGDIFLDWWEDWRGIKSKGFIWTENHSFLLYGWVEHNDDINIKIESNNLVEEIFRFTQSVQNIPEENWDIQEAIRNSWPIWTARQQINR